MSTYRFMEWALFITAGILTAVRFDGGDYWFVGGIAMTCYLAGIIGTKADLQKGRSA